MVGRFSGDSGMTGRFVEASRSVRHSEPVDIEVEVQRFETELAAGGHDAAYFVEQLRTPDPNLQLLIAERLGHLGDTALPSLNAMIDDPSASRNQRYLASWVALTLGDPGKSVAVLLAEVSAGCEWSVPAANALARAHIVEAVAAISDALDQTDPWDQTDLLNLSWALKELGGTVSAATRQRVADHAQPWVRAALEADFPSA